MISLKKSKRKKKVSEEKKSDLACKETSKIVNGKEPSVGQKKAKMGNPTKVEAP